MIAEAYKNRIAVTAAVIVVVVATFLRLHDITRWSLDNDEIAEVRWSSRSFGAMMDAVRNDAVHPPLDYVVHYAISHVHGKEWVHRLPSALFGAATVVAIMLLGRLWFGAVAGVAAGFFAAIAPMHIRYSQEARPYSMALFFLCAALIALELYARSHRRAWAIGWFALVFLSGATLYFAGMVAAAASIFRIAISRRDELATLWRRLPVVVVGWTLLYAPWLSTVVKLSKNPSPQKADRLTWPWWQLRLQTFATGDWLYEPVSLGSWAMWLAVAIGIVIAIRRKSLWTAVFWFVIGTALEIIVLQIHPHYSTPRYLMPSWPAAVILAGAAIGALSSTRAGAVVAFFVGLLFAGYAAITLQTYFIGQRSEWRTIAQYVHDRAKSGEAVILTNNWVDRNFGFYWRRLSPRPDVNVVQFVQSTDPWKGPVWVVTGQCWPRAPLQQRDLMKSFQITEEARVFYIRTGHDLPMNEELCPE